MINPPMFKTYCRTIHQCMCATPHMSIARLSIVTLQFGHHLLICYTDNSVNEWNIWTMSNDSEAHGLFTSFWKHVWLRENAQHLQKTKALSRAMFTNFECVFAKEANGSLLSLRGILGWTWTTVLQTFGKPRKLKATETQGERKVRIRDGII